MDASTFKEPAIILESPPNLQQRLAYWQSERRIRAAAYWHSEAGQRWAGSPTLLLVFERRAAPRLEGDTLILPFEPLEQALAAAFGGVLAALQELARPLAVWGLGTGWLAELEPLYDPARVLERLSRLTVPAQEWEAERARSLTAGRSALAQASGEGMRGGAAALGGLLSARRIALDYAYPALMASLGRWPAAGVRAAHHWRTDLSLPAPRALSLLESLYGLGGENEAKAVLAALRGMGMLPQEREARLALQHGYADGVTRWLRDEVARHHAHDLNRWLYLAPARRERLSVLLGLERSPLGASALEVAGQLLEEALNVKRSEGLSV